MEKFLIRNSESERKRSEIRERNLALMTYGNTKIFGNSSFRHQQEEIIQTILENYDVFVILPTGGGKSLCYQLPAILSKGVTIVVSPLLSLVEDQVSSLIQLSHNGGVPAAYLSSTSTELMIRSVFEDLNRARYGREPYLKLVYVTPERIVKSEATRQILQVLYENEMLSRFIIDEAHCVSSWGHDFRKDYGQLSLLKKEYPQVPIVALTATSRREVSLDTMKILGISNCKIFTGGFDRPNLKFEVCEKPPSQADTYQFILQIIRTFPPTASGILYCMTKTETEKLSDYLKDQNVSVDYYHAGMTKTSKQNVQAAWLEGKINIVCATIAYGMGIDKPDVRFVIHASLAKSLEGYYQEAGRAGRDGQRSDCILLYRPRDVNALERIMLAPPKRKLSQVDLDRLEEMVNYCTNLNNCRRQTFSEVFGVSESSLMTPPSSSSSSSSSSLSKSNNTKKFQRCGRMCDNCLARSQEGFSPSSKTEPPRHIYIPEPQQQQQQQRGRWNVNERIPTNGHWIEKQPKRNSDSGISFSTASGKKIQAPVIQILEDDDDSRGHTAVLQTNEEKKRKYYSDEEEEHERMERKTTRSSSSSSAMSSFLPASSSSFASSSFSSSTLSSHQRASSLPTTGTGTRTAGGNANVNGIGSNSRGQKAFQTGKHLLYETKKTLLSNQTPRAGNSSKYLNSKSSTSHDDEIEIID